MIPTAAPGGGASPATVAACSCTCEPPKTTWVWASTKPGITTPPRASRLARPTEAAELRDRGQHVAVEHVRQQLDEHRPHPGVAAGETGEPDQHGGAHDVSGEPASHPGGVGQDQPAGQLGGHAGTLELRASGQRAEAGVDAVDRLHRAVRTGLHSVANPVEAGLHPGGDVGCQADLRAVLGDREQVGKGQWFATDLDVDDVGSVDHGVLSEQRGWVRVGRSGRCRRGQGVRRVLCGERAPPSLSASDNRPPRSTRMLRVVACHAAPQRFSGPAAVSEQAISPSAKTGTETATAPSESSPSTPGTVDAEPVPARERSRTCCGWVRRRAASAGRARAPPPRTVRAPTTSAAPLRRVAAAAGRS